MNRRWRQRRGQTSPLSTLGVLALFASAHVVDVRAQPVEHDGPKDKLRTEEDAEAKVEVESGATEQTTHVVARVRREVRLTSTTVIGQGDKERAPLRTAEDLLRQVPGFALVQHGSEGKSMQYLLRGFDAVHGSDLEVRVEGIPFNEGSHIHGLGYIDLGLVLPEVVDSVEVQKGPFGLQQGPFAMAGTASFQLGLPETQRGCRVGLTLGTTFRRRGVVTCAPWAEKWASQGAFFAAAGLQDQGFGRHRSIDRATSMLRLPLVQSDVAGKISLLAAIDVARFDLPGVVRANDVNEGLIEFDGTYDTIGGGLTARSLVALNHQWRTARQGWSSVAHVEVRHLRLTENDTGFLLDPEKGDRREQWQQAVRLSADSQYRASPWPWLQFEAGGGVVTNLFSQRQTQLDMAGLTVKTSRALQGGETFAHVRGGLFWRPLRSVQVDGGLRADVDWVQVDNLLDTNVGKSGIAVALSPRLKAMWRPLSWWQFTAAYGRGLRPPEARAFVDDGVNEATVSSGFLNTLSSSTTAYTTSDAFELGTRLLFSPWLVASVSAFATFISQETVYDHTAGTTLALNATRRLGAEAEVHGYPFSWMRLAADATVVDARFVDTAERIPYAPWLQGSAHAQVFWRDTQASLRLRAIAPRALPYGATSSAMTVVDATASTMVEFLRLGLEVSNVLDANLAEGELMFSSSWRAGDTTLPSRHLVASTPLQLRVTVGAAF